MRIVATILLSLATIQGMAQSLKINDAAFAQLNDRRVATNKTGMTILGAWGAANIVGGVAGALASTDQEWKSFHTMNALWGAVNLGIAGMGYMGARKEAGQSLSCDKALARYESNKQLFLINAGLDIAYIGSGVALSAYADDLKDSERWRGYGRSITMQGIFLLVFDGTMYALHQHNNKQWYKLLEGVCVTGNGVGFRYNIR